MKAKRVRTSGIAPEESFDDELTPRKVIADFADNTTFHGVPQILKASSWLSGISWTVITIGAFALFFLQGLPLIEQYARHPVTTNVVLVTDVEYTDFPSVTICNMNKLRRSQLYGSRFTILEFLDEGGSDFERVTEFWKRFCQTNRNADEILDTLKLKTKTRERERPNSIDEWVRWDYFLVGTHLGISCGNNNETNSTELKSDWQKLFNTSSLKDVEKWAETVNPDSKELDEYGQRVEDLILQCSYDGEPCDHRNFSKIQNSHYGNCFMFNHRSTKRYNPITTRKTGTEHGLKLTAFVDEPEYLGIFSHEVGLQISINKYSTYPIPVDDGIAVATGQVTFIGLRKVLIERMQAPYGNCSKKHTRSETFETRFNYTKQACIHFCVQKEITKKCNCVTDVTLDTKLCDVINEEENSCLEGVIKRFQNDSLKCVCPTPCSQTVFQQKLSTSSWPSQKFKRHLIRDLSNRNKQFAKAMKITNNDTSSNLARINIYFEELNYKLIKQSPLYTVEKLFGAIGGLLGLYVGVSVITVFEVIVLIFTLVQAYLTKRNHKARDVNKEHF